MPFHPTSLILFHCMFGEQGLCDHVEHAFGPKAYAELPYLYAVCAIDESSRPDRMVSGLLIKTNVGHTSPSFLDGMSAAFHVVPQLRAGLHRDVSLLAAPVQAEDPDPLNESQSLVVFGQLWSEHFTEQMLSKFSLGGCYTSRR
jgi:hypothetical protein